jgi:peptide methionine sulfoxide reductase msrA/msrB
LLELFFDAIDPTSVNRQGADAGEQYRTGIYYADKADRPEIERSLGRLQRRYGKPIAIE